MIETCLGVRTTGSKSQLTSRTSLAETHNEVHLPEVIGQVHAAYFKFTTLVPCRRYAWRLLNEWQCALHEERVWANLTARTWGCA